MKRTRLRRVGRRKRRSLEAEREFQRNPPGRCERCWSRTPNWWDGVRQYIVGHHRIRKSQGGTHVPDNRAWLCRPCHDKVHDHQVPDWAVWFRWGEDPAQPPLELWDPR